MNTNKADDHILASTTCNTMPKGSGSGDVSTPNDSRKIKHRFIGASALIVFAIALGYAIIRTSIEVNVEPQPLAKADHKQAASGLIVRQVLSAPTTASNYHEHNKESPSSGDPITKADQDKETKATVLTRQIDSLTTHSYSTPSSRGSNESSENQNIIGATVQKKISTLNIQRSGLTSIQVAAVSTEKKAKDLQATLADLGYVSKLESISTPKGRLIRVRIGPFKSREDAIKANDVLSTASLTGTALISHPR